MKTFSFALFAICLLFVGCSKQPDKESEYPSIYFWEDQRRNGDDLWYVCYGTSHENATKQLTFVLFEKGDLQYPPGQRRVVSRTVSHKEGTKEIIDKQEGWLIDSAGGTKMIQLPTKMQLYEIQSGRIVTSEERVTLSQIEQFLESHPEEYSIKALLDFTNQVK